MNTAKAIPLKGDIIRLIPDLPGVYLFKDKEGEALYIGKAKSLKKRLSSYFQENISGKIRHMLKKAEKLEFIVTSNEKEALLLESNLIKKFEPRYNVILRDDKRYPSLKIDLRERFPKVSIARKIEREEGVIYFGPYPSSSALRNTLRVIGKIFKLRTCKNMPKDGRPCLSYQIGRCLGPCIGAVSEEEYRKAVEGVRLFLEGKANELLKKLEKEMLESAERLEFEKAARIRDQINAIKKILERQGIVFTEGGNFDVLGIAGWKNIYKMSLLMVREGHLIGEKSFSFKQEDVTEREIIEAFLKQYYPNEENIPDEIIIPVSVEDKDVLSSWISDISGKEVKISLPYDQKRRHLIDMAMRNARQLLSVSMNVEKDDLCERMKEIFSLRRVPRRIEALDISQIMGNEAVGSIVSFRDGEPEKERYRNFRIRGDYADDYSMMKEVIKRRIKEGDLPDLFIIDGGMAHLQCVKKELEGLKERPEIISIAKSEGAERIYVEWKKQPIELPEGHPVLLFIMRIRDEVHRRAITYHRKLREKKVDSLLKNIPGIGEKKMKKLLKEFRSIDEIANSSVERIASVPGIGLKLAKKIKEYLREIQE